MCVNDTLAFMEENNLTKSFEYQIIPQDASAHINLSEVFFDPDGDTLLFSSEEAENVTITHIDEVAVIIPDDGFCGVRTTKFYAADTSGAMAKSPNITLIFMPVDETSNFQENLRIVLIAALILLLALYLAYRLLTSKN
jgi:hypothetical protein